MHHISEVVSQAVEAKRPPHSPNQPDPEQLRAAAGVINKLFADLQGLFPAWRQSYPGEADLAAAKRAWTRALVESGVTTEKQLQWGLRRARRSGSPFWPSVGQFIQWCQPDPETLGLPSPERAYREACAMAHPAADHSRWSHPAVRVAAREVGLQKLAVLPESETRAGFLRAYKIAVGRVADGEDLGLPSPEEAYREACAMAHPDADQSRWSHPAVRVAAREIGSGSQLPERERRKLFLRAYEIAVRRVADGEDLAAEISRGLPERPAPRPADPETARRHLNRMRQLLRA
jgi:hypothetical protein